MNLETQILTYSKWVIEESTDPIGEIDWLVSQLLETDKKEEIKEVLQTIVEHFNLT